MFGRLPCRYICNTRVTKVTLLLAGGQSEARFEIIHEGGHGPKPQAKAEAILVIKSRILSGEVFVANPDIAVELERRNPLRHSGLGGVRLVEVLVTFIAEFVGLLDRQDPLVHQLIQQGIHALGAAINDKCRRGGNGEEARLLQFVFFHSR